MITVKRYVPGFVDIDEEEKVPTNVDCPVEILKIPFVARLFTEGFSLTVKKYPEEERIHLKAMLVNDEASHTVAFINGVSISELLTVFPIEELTFKERAVRNVITPLTINILDNDGRSGLLFLSIQQQWGMPGDKLDWAIEVLKEVISNSPPYEGYEIVNIFDLEVHLKTGKHYSLEVSATVQGMSSGQSLAFQHRVTVNFLKG
jgi:hypothetical protein